MDAVTEPFGGAAGCRQPASPTRAKPVQPATPELDRLVEVSDESHKLGEFFDWLMSRYRLGTYQECIGGDRFTESYVSPERLLAEYFKIDLGKVDRERMAVLRYVRSLDEQG